MNNTHVNWLIAILLCATVLTPSLGNEKSKEQVKIVAIYLPNQITQSQQIILLLSFKKDTIEIY